jgi:acetyl/propionyl-CoA carboxylase alpha subunit
MHSVDPLSEISMRRDFHRVAIVNRGEPAIRFIHAAHELNSESGADLRCLALYTEPDRQGMFVREADEAFNLGSATFVDPADGQRRSRYLDYQCLEHALRESRAEAAWVGWGFVAEQADFADLCERLNIAFIGPSGSVMRQLGNKIAAKTLAERAGVPIAAWTGGPVERSRPSKPRISTHSELGTHWSSRPRPGAVGVASAGCWPSRNWTWPSIARGRRP